MNINNVRNNFTKVLNANKKQKKQVHTKQNQRLYGKYYGSKYWHQLRDDYYNEHPCCEVCLYKGIVTPAESVHHVIPWLTGVTEEDKWKLLLDYTNLLSVCNHHHQLIHHIMRTQHKNKVSVDEVTQYEAIMNGTF